MSAAAKTSVASEINRLHAEVVRQADESQKCLHAALAAAWRAGRLAGKLLVAIKQDAAHTAPEQWTAFRQDLRALYEQLRRIFEGGPPAGVQTGELPRPGAF